MRLCCIRRYEKNMQLMLEAALVVKPGVKTFHSTNSNSQFLVFLQSEQIATVSETVGNPPSSSTPPLPLLLIPFTPPAPQLPGRTNCPTRSSRGCLWTWAIPFTRGHAAPVGLRPQSFSFFHFKKLRKKKKINGRQKEHHYFIGLIFFLLTYETI